MSVKVLVSRSSSEEDLARGQKVYPSSSPSSTVSSLPSQDQVSNAFINDVVLSGDRNLPQLGLYLLPSETIITILCYLRATDLCSCVGTSKYIFSSARISKSIELSLAMYPLTNGNGGNNSGRNSPTSLPGASVGGCGAPLSRSNSTSYEVDTESFLKPQLLYIHEMKSIIAAVNAQSSLSGYYVSSGWLSNAKKYYEAINLPESHSAKRSTPSKKQTKIRLRRGSDTLPPWPCINADITCCHNALSLPAGPRARRKIIEKRHWKLLRKFYPAGCEFKTKYTASCEECGRAANQDRQDKEIRREDVLRARCIDISNPLHSLFMRKNGVPSSCLKHTGDEIIALHANSALNGHVSTDGSRGEWSCAACTMYNPNSEDTCHMCSTRRETPLILCELDVTTMPLLPGIYNLVPRYWLRSWRQYVKDPSVASVELLDCASLLCTAHGNLIVPPHVDEYIRGVRKALLTNLGDYQGDLYEIVTPDEWDALKNVYNGPIASTTDFAVRFFTDEDGNIEWNVDRCCRCDSFSYLINEKELIRKGSNEGRRRSSAGRSNSFTEYGLEDYICH